MEIVPLTRDHKPNSPEELERIDEAGGRVARLQDESGEEVGPHRVWLRYAWIPGLAMSRALGDALAHRVGVSSVPEISTHEISASDRFLILASDGIWEFITNEEAVMIAASCNSPDEAGGLVHLRLRPPSSCLRLRVQVNEALNVVITLHTVGAVRFNDSTSEGDF